MTRRTLEDESHVKESQSQQKKKNLEIIISRQAKLGRRINI